MSSFDHASWIKSSYSSNPGGCVEVALTSSAVGLRDTKDRSGGTLIFDHRRWASFLRAVKR